MFITIIVIAVLVYFALPSLFNHRERMAELKKDNQDK